MLRYKYHSHIYHSLTPFSTLSLPLPDTQLDIAPGASKAFQFDFLPASRLVFVRPSGPSGVYDSPTTLLTAQNDAKTSSIRFYVTSLRACTLHTRTSTPAKTELEKFQCTTLPQPEVCRKSVAEKVADFLEDSWWLVLVIVLVVVGAAVMFCCCCLECCKRARAEHMHGYYKSPNQHHRGDSIPMAM